MKIASEFITHPRPAEVLDVPEAGFASYLTQVLDKHVSLEVPDFDRHPLALSGIAVTTSVAERMYTARTDELLDDVLGAPPVAHRDFAVDSDLWVYGEIYDHRSGAGDVTASVTVTTTDGKLVYQTPFEPAAVQFGHLARIPLTELGAGSYVATIEARSATPEPVSAMRMVAFRVK